jgi:hypothetical protein
MNTHIRPQDLPEIRAELLDHYNQPFVIDWWSKRPAHPALRILESNKTLAVLNPTGSQRRLNEIGRLSNADLYFVSADMTELATTAATSLPPFDLSTSDAPSTAGLIVFEKPIATDVNTKAGHGETVFISAASWDFGTAPRWGVALWFSFYIDLHLTLDLMVEEGRETKKEAARQKGSQPRFTYTMDAAHMVDRGIPVTNDDSVLNSWGRTILAAWLLMGQPLASTSTVNADRSAQKRIRRIGQEPAPVRVVELRRPKTSSSAGNSDREYHHQWIVRGHWRQQWHPKRQVHRPVWIAPHIKGPEGAPLIGGEKVYALKR